MALDNEFFVGTAGGAASPTILSQARKTTAGGVYMAKLGDYMFALDTAAFQSLQRDTGYRWNTLKRISRSPAAQFTGLDEDTIELSGVIYPHFRGGLSQVGLMRSAAALGKPLPLVYAFESIGQYCGLWCIRSIREGRTEFNRDGTPKKVEFSVSLVAYGEDANGGTISLGDVPLSLSGLLPGSRSLALTSGASAAASMPIITQESSVSDVRAAAAAVSSVAASASAAAGPVVETAKKVSISAGVNTVLGGLSDAIRASNDLRKQGKALQLSVSQIQAAAKVLRDSPGDIKKLTQSLRTLALETQSLSAASGGVVKSYAAKLSEQKPSAGVNNEDRLTAAASLKNLDRTADSLVGSLGTVSEYAAQIAGKIRV